MKIAAEVFGVEQAMDFDTMETTQYCVLGVLGETVRVPISEAQMEALTKAAATAKGLPTDDPNDGGESAFDETRETSSGPPIEARRMEERPFSIVTGLEGDSQQVEMETQQADAPETDPGLGGLFDESEEEKERKLRARQNGKLSVPSRTVPRDEAGNPVVAQSPGANLPRLAMPGMSDDDFPQG